MTDTYSQIPDGTKWCPHCNGYGSSLREDAERCTHCAGTGLVVDEAAAMCAERGENGSASGGEPGGDYGAWRLVRRTDRRSQTTAAPPSFVSESLTLSGGAATG